MTLVYSEKIPLGWKAPKFELLDTDSKKVSLDDFQDSPVLVVVFTCNHCPYAQAAWPVFAKLSQKYQDQVRFVAINSNDPDLYLEDNSEKMAELVIQENISFPYLIDENAQVARAYQAQCTPDTYVFKNMGGGDFQLEYHGRVNDNWQHPEQVTEDSLDIAINNAINDLDPIIDQHPAMGCSIKWSEEEN